MKRKYGFIFLITGIIMFILYGVYNYTNLFVSKKNPDNTIETIKYDYVKSHDMNEKTKITFRVIGNMIMNDYYSDDFYKYYTNSDNLSLTAYISDYKESIDDYESEKYDIFKSPYELKGQTVTSSDILCQYICKRYKVYNKDNTVSADNLKVYIKVSESEMFELSYHMNNEEFSNENIENTINSIKITNDAVYKFGEVVDNKLIINLKIQKEKTLDIILDSSKYEEVIKGSNSIHLTHILNTETNKTVALLIMLKKENSDFALDIDNYFNNGIKKESEVNGMKTYEYTLNDNKYYVIMIDDETALIIETKGESIDINDFTNIKVKGV